MDKVDGSRRRLRVVRQFPRPGPKRVNTHTRHFFFSDFFARAAQGSSRKDTINFPRPNRQGKAVSVPHGKRSAHVLGDSVEVLFASSARIRFILASTELGALELPFTARFLT